MSEYQLHAWLTLDRPLTTAQRRAVDGLSSHMSVTATGAWVEYHWSSFKHDPIQVLADYFDAYLYFANWGSRQLALRFPKDLLDPWPLQPYIVEPYITLNEIGDSYILSWDLSSEEYEDDDFWLDDENWLASVAPLRAAILRGDYRCLYLSWLRAAELSDEDDIAEDEPEPPVPPGLRQPTSALETFINFFNIDKSMIRAAAQASDNAGNMPKIDYATALTRLPSAEADDFLLRLARDEADLSLKLQRRLQALLPDASPQQMPAKRTMAELMQIAEEVEAAERERLRQEADRRREEALAALARREPAVWAEIEQLIETYKSNAYDEATQYLVSLRQLAQQRGELAQFERRLETLATRYGRRSSLIQRFRKNQLL